MTTEELDSLTRHLAGVAPAVTSHHPRLRALGNLALVEMSARYGITAEQLKAAHSQILLEQQVKTVPASPETIEAARAAKQRQIEEQGPKLWDEILLRAVNWKGGDENAYLDSVEARLSCPICKDNFAKYRKENPPAFDRVDFDFFGWAMAKLNAIREEKGKPVWNVAESRAYFLAK